jgi:hypothetical protein
MTVNPGGSRSTVLAAAIRMRRTDFRRLENGCTEQHPFPLFDSARGRTLPV